MVDEAYQLVVIEPPSDEMVEFFDPIFKRVLKTLTGQMFSDLPSLSKYIPDYRVIIAERVLGVIPHHCSMEDGRRTAEILVANGYIPHVQCDRLGIVYYKLLVRLEDICQILYAQELLSVEEYESIKEYIVKIERFNF